MKRIVLATLMLFFAVKIWSQKLCREFEVRFNKNVHELSQDAIGNLDGLIAEMSGDLWIEMTGHTDSSNTLAYNQALSERRVKSVQTYLEKHYLKGKCTFIVFAEGERKPKVENRDEAFMAMNRRVEIRVAKLSEGKLTIPGRAGSSALVKPDFFRGCSVCKTPVDINYWGTGEEAAAAGMPLIADDGDELVTGGMMEISVDCGLEKGTGRCDSVTFVLPGKPDTRMSGWEYDISINRWVPTWANMRFDTLNNLTFLTTYYCGKPVNADYHPPMCWSTISLDSSFDKVHYYLNFGGKDSLVTSSHRILTRNILRPSETNEKQLIEICSVEFKSIRSFGRKKGQYFVGASSVDSIPVKLKEVVVHLECAFDASKIEYRLIPPSDTTVMVKFGKKMLRYRPELWVKAYEFDIPLGPPVKKRITFNYLNYPHEFRLMNGKKPAKTFDLLEYKHKYKRKKKLLKLKVK